MLSFVSNDEYCDGIIFMKTSPLYQGNTYIAMALKLSIALALLFLSRILIYFFNISLFAEINYSHLIFIFFAGLRFDLFSLVILNIPFIALNSLPFGFKYNRIYQMAANFCFYIFNLTGISANFIDVIYFRFTQKRMTIDIFNYVGENSKEILSLLPDFLRDFWFVFVLWTSICGIMIWLSTRIKINYDLIKNFNRKNFLIDTSRLLIVMALFLLFSRGGIQNKPINIINAGEYTLPRYFPVILNTPFTIIKTKDESAVSLKNYFNGKEPDGIFTPVNSFKKNSETDKRLNLVIIILESFSTEHSGYLNPDLEDGNYKGYTPFLDSLMQQSLAYKGYANGEKSIDGIPAIISGIPSLMNSPFLISPYATNDFNSIASLLKETGYSTAFFHGGTNGSMGFESYTKIAGFDKYYGRTEFGNDDYYDGNWGIFDEEFLQFTALKTDQMKEPFFTTVFTLSSHHPYTIPEKYKNKFPAGKQDIHESIGYTDFSLKRFFDTVSRMSWYDHTLFVLTADHTYTGYHQFYKNMVGRYMVPIVFYHINNILPGIGQETTQHTDIFPSVLDYLNYEGNCLSFGSSIFDPVTKRFAVSYNNGTYQLISDNFVYQFDGEKGISLYNFAKDKKLANDLTIIENNAAGEMDTLMKAIIQQFNNRMIRNDLKIKD